MIIIRGSGRCGTGFCAELLTSAGVVCTHEQVFTLHGWSHAYHQIRIRRRHPEMRLVGDSSWLAAPHINRPELHSATVVHLVREPRLVIRSLLRMGFFTIGSYAPYSSYAHSYIPYMEKLDSPLIKAAYMVLRLNWMVEQRADVFHRVEDGAESLLGKLGIDYEGKELFDDTTHNTRNDYSNEEVDLNELPAQLQFDLQQIGERYGYQGNNHNA